jgi:hypothetical protein
MDRSKKSGRPSEIKSKGNKSWGRLKTRQFNLILEDVKRRKVFGKNNEREIFCSWSCIKGIYCKRFIQFVILRKQNTGL